MALAVMAHGLGTMASHPRLLRPGQEFPPVMRDGDAPLPSPYPPDLSWFHFKRRNVTGSSRIPSRLAHHARPVRQCRADVTLSRLLPPSPPIHGSGCLQLHPAAATARRWRSFTSIRDNSASRRTSSSERPAHRWPGGGRSAGGGAGRRRRSTPTHTSGPLPSPSRRRGPPSGASSAAA
jgi:hypothetical protein